MMPLWLKILAARVFLLSACVFGTWLAYDEIVARSPEEQAQHLRALWIGLPIGVVLGVAYVVYRYRKGGPAKHRPPTSVIIAAVGLGIGLQAMGGSFVMGIVATASGFVGVCALSPRMIVLPSMRVEDDGRPHDRSDRW
jgi:hypothetical protein